MEILAHRSYRELAYGVHFWRTKSGLEVDFVLGEGEVAVEVKGTSRVDASDLRSLGQVRIPPAHSRSRNSRQGSTSSPSTTRGAASVQTTRARRGRLSSTKAGLIRARRDGGELDLELRMVIGDQYLDSSV